MSVVTAAFCIQVCWGNGSGIWGPCGHTALLEYAQPEAGRDPPGQPEYIHPVLTCTMRTPSLNTEYQALYETPSLSKYHVRLQKFNINYLQKAQQFSFGL